MGDNISQVAIIILGVTFIILVARERWQRFKRSLYFSQLREHRKNKKNN